jgi:hypothetical protein
MCRARSPQRIGFAIAIGCIAEHDISIEFNGIVGQFLPAI